MPPWAAHLQLGWASPESPGGFCVSMACPSPVAHPMLRVHSGPPGPSPRLSSRHFPPDPLLLEASLPPAVTVAMVTVLRMEQG